jgi:CheY-like chemotaxis protein
MFRNILLIDDDSIDNFINSSVIKNCEITERIEKFNSGKAALEFLKSSEFDHTQTPGLIFLDVNMPEMNGFEFLEEYAKLGLSIRQRFKIIMLSSSLHPEDLQKAEADPYVFQFAAKPLTMDYLLSIKVD